MADHKQHLQFFSKYIESQLGIVYGEANSFQLEHRLKEIAVKLGFKDLEELYQKAQLSITGEMKKFILNDATNNETSFFRDPALFKCLNETLLPSYHVPSGSGPLRIWSAACSSGQEAYSIAMCVHQWKKLNPSFRNVEILLTDVSDRILAKARDGVYTDLEVKRGLTDQQISTYFDKSGDHFKVKPFLQEGMSFKHLNLLESFSGLGPFSLVFCRNVLIYMNVENKKKVLAEIHKSLLPGGNLFLGAAESLFGLSDEFTQASCQGAIVYTRK